MKISPTRDIIHIKADEVQSKSNSGLFLNEDWKTLPPYGTVLAVGPMVKSIKVGDRVVFERYASILLDDKTHQTNIGERLCQESHILGVLSE